MPSRVAVSTAEVELHSGQRVCHDFDGPDRESHCTTGEGQKLMADAVIAVGGVNAGKCHELAALKGYIQRENAHKCNLERCATSLSMVFLRDHSLN